MKLVILRLWLTVTCFSVLVAVLREWLVDQENLMLGAAYISLLLCSLVLYFVTCFTDPGYISLTEKKKTVCLLLRFLFSWEVMFKCISICSIFSVLNGFYSYVTDMIALNLIWRPICLKTWSNHAWSKFLVPPKIIFFSLLKNDAQTSYMIQFQPFFFNFLLLCTLKKIIWYTGPIWTLKLDSKCGQQF